MSVPSMVHRSGDTLVVRSVVSGDALYGTDESEPKDNDVRKPALDDDDIVDAKDLPECKVKRNYSCAICDFFTQNPRSFLYHLRNVHNEKVKIYECPNCLYASKHFQKLLRHTKMVHGSGATASATEQPRAFRSTTVATRKRSLEEDSGDEFAADLAKDVVADDDDKPVVHKCSMCAHVAKTAAQLSKHERDEHIKTKFFRCTKCTYVTHMKARFTKHVKYHSMPMIKCDMCDFRTPYKWNLDRHCKNHNGRGTFRCSACNFTADIKQSLTVHEMNHHVPPVGQAAGLGVGRRRNKVGASDSTAAEDGGIQVPAAEQDYAELVPRSAAQKTNVCGSVKVAAAAASTNNGGNKNGKAETDFVHPDDIVHHSNGKVYIKNKCRFCTFKTAWESEMVRHEQQSHSDLMLTPPKKKVTRPVPGLLPISLSPKEKRPETMSQTDMDKILASSRNSDLKDFAKLFGGDDDMFATGHSTTTPQAISFFDKFKANMCDTESLTCEHCGHESKYLTEHTSHKKSCGKVPAPTHNITSMHKLTSTRCQHCRQRCKSSKDLYNHLQTCEEALKANVKEEYNDAASETECLSENNNDKKPHPMENKVFIWNNPNVEDNDSNMLYESFADSHCSQDQDQMSIDLSIRAQSPTSESSGSLTNNNNNNNNNNTYEKPPGFEKYYQQTTPAVATPTPTTTDKIPTHGNDISVAQHKRVFKCPHCTFWASTASRFHVHIVGHLNKKPFECSLCAYRSNWRWDITKHIKLKSVRDPAHESAKVLMTDETGRRNYTKYNKYLTEIPLKGGQEETSGGMGTRPREKKSAAERNSALRPPPQLKPANEYLSKVVPGGDKKKPPSGDGKKTYWQCKQCNYRDLCKDKCLHHVRGHVQGWSSGEEKMAPAIESLSPPLSGSSSRTWRGSELDSEASFAGGGVSRGQAPFRCGHCHQVSNWKHVIQRHCRLKHAGDVKVVIGSSGNVDESFEQMDVVQDGSLKCAHCPFSSDDAGHYHMHLEGHIPRASATIKCHFCNYYVSQAEDLQEHLKLHGASGKTNAAVPKDEKPQLVHDAEQASKRYKCATCPYVTNSKSQFTYHKQFHQPKNGQYSCSECSYNVSKRHLLHQHMKVHGITISPQKQNGEVVDMEEISDVMEEVYSLDWQNLNEIPLVWVSKGGKFSKMYRCRYCPHVNLRKVNIMEHEKMHGSRDRILRCAENEHRCPACNYVCNNAGVLSSHNKVHQGLYGVVYGIVDSSKTDEEQIRELGAVPNSEGIVHLEGDTDFEAIEQREMLFFCDKCPARFLKKNEHDIHATFHGAGLQNRCDNCTYSSQQKAYLQGHSKVHSNDYQERTKILIETNVISPENPQPTVVLSEHGWVVDDASSEEEEPQENGYVYSRRMNVPLSGTDLFLQKSEAEANEGVFSGSMMRVGRAKEKRYKCPKCPSAFEKREQFKLHLGLHGSNQQYACAFCDYAVSNQANLLQHEKKHNAIKSELEDEIEEIDASASPPARGDADMKKQFWCSMCPYTNTRRDAVDNHQKRHVKLSGLQSNYTCNDCDYSVPQMHVLRDHMKLHFLPNKMHSPDGYMSQDITEFRIKVENNDDYDQYRLGDDDVDSSPLNNNEGEKLYVNTQTGEIGESAKDSEMDTS